MDEHPSSPPRGWYPDPGGTRSWRWWDGASWTDEVQPYRSGPEVAPEVLAGEERAAERMVKLGLPLLLLSVAVGGILRSFEVSYLADTLHWARHAIDQATAGNQVSMTALPVQPAITSTISTLVVLPAAIASLIFILIAQHKMATTARAVGLTARISPTWGVVLWFIPLINLVVVLVWLDMLPARHPLRRSIVWIWALLLLSQVALVAATLAAVVSPFLVGLGSSAEIGLVALATRLGQQVVPGIVAEHRAGGGTNGHTAPSAP